MIRSFIASLTLNRWTIASLIRWFTDSLTQWLNCKVHWTFEPSCIASLTRWFIESVIHSLIQPFHHWFHSFLDSVLDSTVIDLLFVGESLTNRSFLEPSNHWLIGLLIQRVTGSMMRWFIDSLNRSLIPFIPFIPANSFHVIARFFRCKLHLISFQLTNKSYKQICCYSHVHFSKLPPRRVPGTIGNNGL